MTHRTGPVAGTGHRDSHATQTLCAARSPFSTYETVSHLWTPDAAGLPVALHTDTLESRTGLYRQTGQSKTRRLQRAFANHLRRLGHRYPKEKYPRVVLLIDNAPWHAGEPIRQALAEHPHLELKRLPAYSPQLNPIERFWRVLRRRATHNRLFDTLADLKRSVRNSLCYFQTMRSRVVSLVEKSFRRKATASAAS